MIYMYALPRAMPEFKKARIAGEIIYNTHTRRVPRGGIDQGFVKDLGALISVASLHQSLLHPFPAPRSAVSAISPPPTARSALTTLPLRPKGTPTIPDLDPNEEINMDSITVHYGNHGPPVTIRETDTAGTWELLSHLHTRRLPPNTPRR